jgi:DNA polymerase III alpha subunit
MEFARNRGQLTSPGRGSAAGSLILYLLNITKLDPIEHNLLFSRFYNKSRNIPDNINFDEYPFDKHNTKTTDKIKNINSIKYKTIKNNQYLAEEVAVVESSKRLKSYYNYIIGEINIDRSNPNNSYLMWLADKVDAIDLNKPTKINHGRTALPDVDCDFEKEGREDVIEYIRERFGRDKVAQMITFTRLQGRSAIKEVLRVNSSCSFEEMNKITEFIPDEAAIIDKLQEMRDADKENGGDGEASIIEWALENNAEQLKPWCYIDEHGKLQGPLAKRFEQAIRLEGTKKNSSKHASGIVISNEPLAEMCPMVYDGVTGERIAGLEMADLEAIGLVKFDILGLSFLSNIHNILKMIG